MNVLGHVHAALAERRDDAAFLLGAVLPDLRGLHVADRTGAVGEGIACHHRVDAAFHADAAFRAGSGALRRDLLDAGLATGPARAVGHAGWELLLDGTLVGSPADDGFRAALVHAGRPGPHGRLRYDDPAWVAERLFALLDGRPRLRFARADLPTVAAVLGRHAPAVREAAPDLLRRVTQAASRSL